MSWQILLAISILASVSWTLLQRVIMKDEESDPIAFSIVSNLIAGGLLFIVACIKGFSLAHVPELFLNLVLMAVLYAIANLFMFKSLKVVEASEFTVLFTTRALWSIVAAILFLHEVFSVSQFLGTLLIISGVVLVSLQVNKFRLKRGEVFVLICAAAFGLEFVNDAKILQQMDVFLYSPLVFIIPNLLLWAIFPKSTKRIVTLFTSPVIKKILLLGVFFAVSAAAYLYAYQVGKNAAEIASINQTQTVLTVVAATILLKERKHYLKKIIASILTFIGVLLVK